MSAHDQIVRLADGNPGALRVLCAGLHKLGGDFPAAVDKAGLTGSSIWVCFKDECGEDLAVMLDRLGGNRTKDPRP